MKIISILGIIFVSLSSQGQCEDTKVLPLLADSGYRHNDDDSHDHEEGHHHDHDDEYRDHDHDDDHRHYDHDDDHHNHHYDEDDSHWYRRGR